MYKRVRKSKKCKNCKSYISEFEEKCSTCHLENETDNKWIWLILRHYVALAQNKSLFVFIIIYGNTLKYLNQCHSE